MDLSSPAEILEDLFAYFLIAFNLILVLKGSSKAFRIFLVFLFLGQTAELAMDYFMDILDRVDLAWEVRYIYGFFDTVLLLWLATAYGNYSRPKRVALITAAFFGGIWLLFLLLHYLNFLEFNAAIMESSASVVLSLALGFGVLSRVEKLEDEHPLLNPINLLLISQLVYVFCTVVIFGIQGTAIRERFYDIIHGSIHALRNILILFAFIMEYRRLTRTKFQAEPTEFQE